MSTTTMRDLEDYVKQIHGIDELESFKRYPTPGLKVETLEGFKDVLGFMKKPGMKVFVTFESGLIHEVLDSHMYIPEHGDLIFVTEIIPGTKIKSVSGIEIVKSVEFTHEKCDGYDLSVDALDGVYVGADGVAHHNTGKTQTVERSLAEAGLSDGNGYIKISGTASAAGIYRTMYHHRDQIILFDDCDSALMDGQEGRNLIKNATNTAPIRKLMWAKQSSFIYDPDRATMRNEEDPDMAPSHFNFSGKVIFISNMDLNKLDPDRALRTRAFILNINPSNDEMVSYMEKILHKVHVQQPISASEREEVMDVIRDLTSKNSFSLRLLQRGLTLRASGIENWAELLKYYG